MLREVQSENFVELLKLQYKVHIVAQVDTLYKRSQ